MRRAKIVCTLGPASSSDETILKLIEAGMDAARLNFSHGTHAEHGDLIHRIRTQAQKLSRPVAILQDLEGPRIRVGVITGGSVLLKPSGAFTLTTRTIEGDQHKASMSYAELPRLVRAGDPILLNDGTVELQVEETTETDVRCRVIVGGTLSSHKGINLPTRSIALPAFTAKDRDDLLFGIGEGVDFAALSFVKSAEDIENIKQFFKEQKSEIPVIAKIEKHEALEGLDEILEASDGVMVARGDLGVEIPLEKIPLAQKEIIRKANAAGKPVITATQMLRSMVENPGPTRAEVTDVANAILDGTDAVMLSEETAVGRYPVEAVATLSRIMEAAESDLWEGAFRWPTSGETIAGEISIPDAACQAAAQAATAVRAKGIVVFTQSGTTARLISKYRPSSPIFAFTPSEEIRRRTSLYWGVVSRRMDRIEQADRLIAQMERHLRQEGWAGTGDRLVILFGFPIDRKGPTNMVKLHTLE
jgi:pyruvate kinase